MTGRLRMMLVAVLLALGAPVAAHNGHHHPEKPVAATVTASAAHPAATATATHSAGEAMAPMMHDGDDKDRSTMTTGERLLDWLGRLHVSVVHFPLALFPAALLAALLERRRPGFAGAARFLIIVGGFSAPLVALFGWLDGGLVIHDSDPLLQVHRWLGTLVGLSGLGLGLWALRRPGAERGTAMLVALVAITGALLVQAWYGGAMVHGIDHMNW